jgi:hypothetical protein
MKNLVYVSTARTMLSDDALFDILALARKNNHERNVTGVLLYSEGTFIQVLEGANGDVDAIFKKIEQDVRHKNVIVLMNEPLLERNFPNWWMGFTSVDAGKSAAFIDNLITTDQILSETSDNTAVAMLKVFIESNNLVINQ